MKQIVQSPRTGKLELLEVPAPSPGPGLVLVRTAFSAVSPGTEKMAMDFARSSLLGKARKRPDLVRQVTRKLRQEGPLQTYRAVTSRLDSPQPLGYSLAGVVEAVGEGVTGFAPGDRVACAGAGYANHAELNVVPENLVARLPEGVDLAQAAYATVGAIALQGLRLARPTLGEVAAVIGLGLIGQLTVQLLRANGCRVLGLDTEPARVKQALANGAEWGFTPAELPAAWKDEVTDGHGVDMVLLAASTDSNAPIELAGELCRLKGRVSIIGAVSMDLDRRTFFGKELEVHVSMSYGPGRYDWRYEEAGFDYPLPYVRWTENRNLQAFLGLLASGAVDPQKLETETVPFAEAERAYEELAKGERRALSLLFRYDEVAADERTLPLAPARAPRDGELGVAFLGAGNYAKGMLLPALERCDGVRRLALVTATGASARRTAERFGFASCGTDPGAVLGDESLDLVFVATRHDSHAALAVDALRRGKAVWLEKPVGLDHEEIDAVVAAARETGSFLTIGYNRRFSPHTRAIRDAFATRQGPLAIHYAVSPGPPPAGTWHTDPRVGGGRVIGEVCHFVDLCTHLVGAPPASVQALGPGRDPDRDDSVVALLGFPDGSAATISYLASASPDLPKERIEVSGDGRTARCDNFKSTEIRGAKGVKTLNQDKGQAQAVAETLAAVREGRPSPIPLDEIAAGARATLAILESVRSGAAVRLDPRGESPA
ncbi:MAG: bi-domain-containing oxidoreductase [Myxococcota bacterium]|nr:bi-domain-containing oxidoreductase [Myxococcota bacterium]